MRGLTLFISDIRKCRCKDDEIKRINKELANIRTKFKGIKPLNGYHKKKYVCKLLFMFLLGHKTDFGDMEAVNLLSSNAYSEKQIGYLFISVVMKRDHNFIPLVINNLKNDLKCSNQIFQNLALQFISNNANRVMAEDLGHEVYDILVSSDTSAIVKQTATLTLLQLLRITPDLISYKQYSNCLIHLLSHYNLGLVTASASLLEWLASKFPSQFDSCVKHAVIRLHRIVNTSSEDFRDYTYCNMAAPWLVVKLLRLLQKFSIPTDMSIRVRFRESLELILNKSKQPVLSKHFECNNARYAVIFEAIYTIIQMNVDSLLSKAIGILGSTLKHKEPNLRYITLDIMTRLSNREDSKENIKMHWESILDALQSEADITLKKCAVDLLYNICDKNNVKTIVEEMLYFLEEQDESAGEVVVLKSAILAEQFSTDLNWYVDTIFKILQICGDNVNDKIWFALVKVVIDNDSVQEHSARVAYRVLDQKICSDIVVKVAGYILGEFGYFIATDRQCSQLEQLNILQEKFSRCSVATRGLLLTTYMKFLNLYPDLKDRIQSILRHESNMCNENVELQQRAVEYLRLSQVASQGLLASVLEEMPSCKRQESAVLEVLQKRKIQIFNNSSNKTSSNQAKKSFHSSCSILNINQYVQQEINEISRYTSYRDLRQADVSSKVDLLVDIFNESSNFVPLSSASSEITMPPFQSSASMKPTASIQPIVSMLSITSKQPMDLIQPMSPIPPMDPIPPMAPLPPIVQMAPLPPMAPIPPMSQILQVKAPRISPAPSNEKLINNLLFNEDGVLFEDLLVKIEIRSEFKKHYGRFHIIHKNKSSQIFSDFTIQGNFAGVQNKCSIWFKPSHVDVLENQALEQDIHLECLSEFTTRPSLTLKFTHEGNRKEIKLILPLTINKFVEPSVMSPDDFVKRWENYANNGQEVSRYIVAKYPMIYGVTKFKLIGFRLAVIQNDERDFHNFHCAAVFFTRSIRIGFLVQLERYPEANKYRCIVRSGQKSFSQNISNLLLELL